MKNRSMFYMNFEAKSDRQRRCIEAIQNTELNDLYPIFLLKKPVIEKKVDYKYQEAFILLMPKHKVIFIDFGNDEDAFKEYKDDIIDDIGYIAKKYDFVSIIGRPRVWSKELISDFHYNDEGFSFDKLLKENEIMDKKLIRKGDMLISLVNGSINEANRLGQEVPQNRLDQIKKNIILFDGDQTRFIFDEPQKKRITIQGLAGTGKTELLLHKIKELYTDNDESKIVFTCHNVILADSLKKRVPVFFDFMKVEEQIQWEKRLWVMRSWGTFSDCNSGVYSYICNYYNIPFRSFSYERSFDIVCKEALNQLNNLENFHCCFDYILIDESQDFSEGFFKLCEKVTRKCVYVAGDIFQDIFDNKILSVVNPDFLLNRCYRTDPRTLMGAHAIGMGLFEEKLRWLKDDEWEACGYDLVRKDNMVELHRKPLRRFEEVDVSSFEGITIIPSKEEEYLNAVLNTIERIRANNPTVTPDDIGIIFMENVEMNFKLASSLQSMIMQRYDWRVNIGYETKEQQKNTIFISNRNNVKGLEFPFVICIMQSELTHDFSMRNSIYMMLTRSFLTSYLILPSGAENIKLLEKGISFVNEFGYLNIEEPSENEKILLSNAIINRKNILKPLSDMTDDILDEMGVINKETRHMIHSMTKARFVKEVDRDKLELFIRTNCSMME